MKLFYKFLFILTLASCGQVTTINFNKHIYNTQPTKIVWFQIAGLTDEHLALLKFNQTSTMNKISFENMTCSGRLWNYDLFNIRSQPQLGFLSQIVGKKNIKNTCEDFALEPIWDTFEKNGYRTYILENNVTHEKSLDQKLTCEKTNPSFMQKVALYRMSEGKGEEFHFSENIGVVPGLTYFDKSCRKENCYSGLFNNFQAIHEKIKNVNYNYLYIVRDFGLYEALKEKKIILAKDRLAEIERTLQVLMDQAALDKEMTILISSSAPYEIEFPSAGEKWQEFDKNGSNIIFHNTSLMSPLYIYGARSENFCGIMEQAQVFERLLTAPAKQGFSLPLLNF